MKGIFFIFTFIFVFLANARAEELETLKLQPGDEVGNEIRALQTELLVSSTEAKAVDQLRMLLKKYRGTPVEPDLWFRLAELHMRRSKSQRFFEMQRVTENEISFLPQKVRTSSSKNEIGQAIKYYQVIRNRFPNFSKIDIVTFNQAFALQSIAEDKKAEGVYWSLIKKFPSSPLVADSHLAIGEINFSRNQFKHALDHFLAVERFPSSKVFPYALYKSGWSYYNLQQAHSGIEKLEQVVEYGEKVEKERLDSRLDLRREALLDLTIFFEDVYPAESAFAYFEKLSGNLDVEPTLMRLAELYERHSRWNDKKIIYLDILKKRPMFREVPLVIAGLVKNSDDMKDKKQAVHFLEKLYSHCDSNKKWFEYQIRNQTESIKAPESLSILKLNCEQELQDSSLKYAGKWLRIWKKNNAFEDFAMASKAAFNIYFRVSPKTREAQEARFAYAELLFALKDYRQASDQYALVGDNGKLELPDSMSHDASYAAIVSLEKAVEDKWSEKDEASFHRLAEQYLSAHPKGQFVLDVEFKVALIAYEKNRYDEAGGRFLRIGRAFPKEPKGVKAQDLYLDILNLKKDFAGLKMFTTELLNNEELSAERSQELAKLYRQAYFLEIQGFEEQGQLDRALTEYQKFADEFVDEDLGKSALWNAIAISAKLNKQLLAAELGVRFFDRYPSDLKAKEALLNAINVFESMAKLDEAAQNLLRLSKVDNDSRVKWKLLAAQFFFFANKPARARTLLLEIAEKGESEERGQAVELWAQMEERSFHGEKVDEDLKRHIVELKLQPYHGLLQVKQVERLFEEQQFEKAFADSRQLVGLGSLPKNLKARARLVQAKILMNEFERQSVKSRADRVAMVLALKTEKLEKAQAAFQDVLRYKDSNTSIVALESLADLYLHYVDSLKNMPTPSGLSAQDEKLFRAEIDQIVFPLEEKGVEALELALKSTQSMRYFPDDVERLRARLDLINMKSQPKVSFDKIAPAPLLPVFSRGVGS